MTGSKATALEAYAQSRGHAFVRFDYQGHGASSGAFRDGTIGTWADDAVAILDQVTEGPQILVGSSMGGWIMLLAALARPDRVRALVGIAPAPDFTERLMWAGMNGDARATLMRDGEWRRPSLYDDAGYPITRALIEDGRRHLLLNGPIALPPVPVRLIHGQRDPDVPWRTSLDLAAAVAHEDVRVTLVKDGDHRLSTPQNLDLITHTVGEFLD
ncbi:carboxylesterase [Azospirillum sp. B4]|uniref:alpha/beta hydrolase n=1 Tax=Azospirillum sp. B4 TaxID=95605 RepID=UPI00034A7078|nr:alpha/beta fold hydrolase [Azospirillum sp. B4]